jgi:hypothetical protein
MEKANPVPVAAAPVTEDATDGYVDDAGVALVHSEILRSVRGLGLRSFQTSTQQTLVAVGMKRQSHKIFDRLFDAKIESKPVRLRAIFVEPFFTTHVSKHSTLLIFGEIGPT